MHSNQTYPSSRLRRTVRRRKPLPAYESSSFYHANPSGETVRRTRPRSVSDSSDRISYDESNQRRVRQQSGQSPKIERRPIGRPGSTQQRTQNSNQGRRIQRANPQSQQRRRIQPASSGGSGQRRPPQNSSGQNRRPVQKKPRINHKVRRRIIITLLVIVAVLGGGYAYLRFSPLNPDLYGNYKKYGISKSAASTAKSERIFNVAVFGVDGREGVEGERSDSIMIVSADYQHSKIKVTSLMRDTYTYYPENDDFDKLNAAYSEGGAENALKIINTNFDTPITDYITIDFTALVQMVNAVGGVEINVETDEELYWINQYLWDVNDKVKTNDPELTQTGVQTLTGSQALAYSRIRYTGNGDYDRTQRQRNVLEQVVNKAKKMNPFALISLVQKVMPYIDTSLSITEIGKNIVHVLLLGNAQIEQYRFPADGMVTDGYIDGVSYVFPMTLDDNIVSWYQFVYEKTVTPSETAQNISSEIEDAYY